MYFIIRRPIVNATTTASVCKLLRPVDVDTLVSHVVLQQHYKYHYKRFLQTVSDVNNVNAFAESNTQKMPGGNVSNWDDDDEELQSIAYSRLAIL